MSELLLGIDIGTASSEAVLARPDGTIEATATRPHRLSMPRPGWFEHDAEEVWWSDVAAAEAVGVALAGSSWVVTRRVVEPDPATRATYDELYGHYRALYPATQTVQHALARFQHETTGG